MCTVLLPPGGYLTAVNNYIISYHIIYRIVSYHISYHTISCIIISYHISYRIISYIISYHIMYHHIIPYLISYHIRKSICNQKYYAFVFSEIAGWSSTPYIFAQASD